MDWGAKKDWIKPCLSHKLHKLLLSNDSVKMDNESNKKQNGTPFSLFWKWKGVPFLSHQEPTGPSKQPIRTRYLGHATGYQPIREQYLVIRSVAVYHPMHPGDTWFETCREWPEAIPISAGFRWWPMFIWYCVYSKNPCLTFPNYRTIIPISSLNWPWRTLKSNSCDSAYKN